MPENSHQSFSHRFFSNRDCEFFPCHSGLHPAKFNCLFCYCPLYWAANCGGVHSLLPTGQKDCSRCVVPHKPENYADIVSKLGRLSPAPSIIPGMK